MKNYQLYAHSERAFDAMHEAVVAAKRSIYWESYIFTNDLFLSHDFFSLFDTSPQSSLLCRFGELNDHLVTLRYARYASYSG